MRSMHRFGVGRVISVITYGAIVLLVSLVGAMPSRAESGVPVKVFRCQGASGAIFSDQPCPGAAQSTEVVLPPSNSYHEEQGTTYHSASKSVPVRERSSKRSDSIAAEQLREKQRCQRLADQLESLRNRMRAGYTAKQGEKLSERQRELEQRRKTERCR